jgi:hypothetical protein
VSNFALQEEEASFEFRVGGFSVLPTSSWRRSNALFVSRKMWDNREAAGWQSSTKAFENKSLRRFVLNMKVLDPDLSIFHIF